MPAVEEAVTGISIQLNTPPSASKRVAPRFKSLIIVGPWKVEVPVTVIVPATWSVELGAVVPIPTLCPPLASVVVALVWRVATFKLPVA